MFSFNYNTFFLELGSDSGVVAIVLSVQWVQYTAWPAGAADGAWVIERWLSIAKLLLVQSGEQTLTR